MGPYYNKLNHDARQDLGYGRTSPRFHVPRQKAPTYPYTEPDQFEDVEVEVDEESMEAVPKKVYTTGYTVLDRGAAAKSDPFYFAAGNTKLSDCIYRPDEVLAEVHAMGDTMYPMPQMYKGKNVNFGPSLTGDSHAQYLTPGSPLRTGTLRGWSKSPAPIEGEEDADETVFDLEDLLALAYSRES